VLGGRGVKKQHYQHDRKTTGGPELRRQQPWQQQLLCAPTSAAALWPDEYSSKQPITATKQQLPAVVACMLECSPAAVEYSSSSGSSCVCPPAAAEHPLRRHARQGSYPVCHPHICLVDYLVVCCPNPPT
jgi:hypothetical protein